MTPASQGMYDQKVEEGVCTYAFSYTSIFLLIKAASVRGAFRCHNSMKLSSLVPREEGGCQGLTKGAETPAGEGSA